MNLSKTMAQVRESDTLAFFARVKALKASGVDVISLVAGELDEPTPEVAKAAGHKAIDDNFTRYTLNTGTIELRRAIAEKLQRDNEQSFTPDQIVVSAGVKQAMFNVVLSLCGAGDEVVIFAPYWPTYPQQVKIANATPVIVETRASENFQIDENRLRAAMSRRTKLIITCSPNNPTGAVFTKESFEVIAKIATEFDCWILSDEIYEELVFPPAQHYTPAQIVPEIASRTIIVNGFSKAFAMTGWRIGYSAGPKEVMDAAATIQSHSTSNACSLSQAAALAAMQQDPGFAKRLIPKLLKNRDAAMDILATIPGMVCPKPEGAFYLFPDIRRFFGRKAAGQEIKGSDDLCMYLLNQSHAAVVPGSGFGADTNLRISYATSYDQVVEGCKRIKTDLEALL
jgi:aspartate aminotransferase